MQGLKDGQILRTISNVTCSESHYAGDDDKLLLEVRPLPGAECLHSGTTFTGCRPCTVTCNPSSMPLTLKPTLTARQPVLRNANCREGASLCLARHKAQLSFGGAVSGGPTTDDDGDRISARR